MAQKQVTPGEASLAVGALEGLLLGVGTFVPLQMLQTGKCALAGSANMWPRLVRLRRREVGGCFGVDGNGGGFCIGICILAESRWYAARRGEGRNTCTKQSKQGGKDAVRGSRT